MVREIVLSHEFVEFIPNELKERTLYISYTYCTVLHKCCCGCGREVVTPLSPTDWKIIFDGKTVSLYPSIGSWNLPCQSHYFITSNRVVWAPRWSREEIEAGSTENLLAKKKYFCKSENKRKAKPKKF